MSDVPESSSQAESSQVAEVAQQLEKTNLEETVIAEEAAVKADLSQDLDPALVERFNRIRSVGEECVQESELLALLQRKPQPICYDGFEPSGRVHIAQGIMKAINVNKLTSSGCKFIFLVADWFALMNNKMGGDLDKIRKVGEYMIEVWRAAGMNLDNVEFLWTSEIINAKSNEYWLLVLDIARKFNLARVLRCSQIMGRDSKDDLSAAQIMYPCMQCADIFFLKADICQLGMDQRKVNMLAREYCTESKRKFKPIILSHHMLGGLKEGQIKMSKSDPDSAIFMEDSEADVNRKIKKAFCPPQIVENNPCVEYVEHIVLPLFNEFLVSRSADNGGDVTYTNNEDLERDYKAGALHPGDLKSALAKSINRAIQPVRDHFTNDPTAKKLLQTIKNYKVTK